jgi:transcriptional regulator with XRE-family HTH domain
MDTSVLLGNRVRDLRKKRNLTQEKLAELAGVDISYLGNIERGTENPTVATLEKLATALSTKAYQILNFEHALQGERVLRRRLVQILDKCDEHELQIILKIAIAIKE